jgi:predicted dehydrogenase
VLLDLVSHHLDLVAALTGQRIVAVQCILRSLRSADDTASVQFVTDGGLAVQLQASFAAGAQVNRLDLVGRRGALRVDLLEGRSRRIQQPPGRGARLRRALDALAELHPARLLRSPGAEPSFASTVEAFLDAVRQGTGFTPDLEDGLRALAVVEAAAASARSGGRSVPVDFRP